MMETSQETGKREAGQWGGYKGIGFFCVMNFKYRKSDVFMRQKKS